MHITQRISGDNTANVLQVINPSPNTDNRILGNQGARNHLSGQRIHNSVDPARVIRADGQEEGKTSTATGEGEYSVVGYGDNYDVFIQRLGNGTELPRLLKQLLFGDRVGVLFAGQRKADALVEQLFSPIQMDSSEALRGFLMEQQAQRAKFPGPFFAGLRSLLIRGASSGLKDAVMVFVKGSNDYSSGRHLLQQMHSLTRGISQLVLKNYKTDFRQLVDKADWEAENGDTVTSTTVLSGRLIPFLSNYISQTHDYGIVRGAVMLSILHAIRYENSQEDRLVQLFERMTGNRELERLPVGDARNGLASALEGLDQRPGSLTNVFSTLVLEGTDGQAGIENVQLSYNILNSMLLGKSVYLPLLHILTPLCRQGKNVMPEIWASPGAEGQKENGRRTEMLFKFHVRRLGRLGMILVFQDRRVEMQLYVPPFLAEKAEIIQDGIAEILEKSGMDLNWLLMREKTGDIRLEAMFPGIREREKGINVRIR